MSKSTKAFVGMDVHKESIGWAVAEVDGKVRSCGRLGGDLMAVATQCQARNRLQMLLLRNDIRNVGKTAWTPAHQRWIARFHCRLFSIGPFANGNGRHTR